MATLDTFIFALTGFKNNLPKTIDGLVNFHSEEFISVVQSRLFGRGMDGNGSELESYSERTILHKVATRQPFNRTTLNETGSFYDGMFVKSNSGLVTLFSSDNKSSLLEDHYGSAIFDFTEPEQNHLTQTLIEPSIEKILKELPKHIEISIT